MRVKFTVFFFAIALIVSPYKSFSQLIVENTMTVEQLVTDVLVGQGVAVSNIMVNGQPANQVVVQAGYFNSDSSNIGISEGFMLATGGVVSAIGPNDQGGNTVAGIGDGYQDADIASITAPNSSNDVIAVEFDFVPNGDTVVFNYVFGSEEYNYYVCGPYMDAFGFFISGPGIVGPYSSPAGFPDGSINIALIPGTDIPVSINTVNQGSPGGTYPVQGCPPGGLDNSQYFLDYDYLVNGFPNPYDSTESQLDGMTTVLQAIAYVTCGLTYHIKLVICDAGDSVFDSFVFLEKDSFSSNAAVAVSLDLTAGQAYNTLFEDCGVGTLIFERFGDFSLDEWIYLETAGVAIAGVDYTNIPDSLVFPAGQNIISYQISGVDDGVFEGPEPATLYITNVASECSNATITSEMNFFVAEPLPIEVTSMDTDVVCIDTLILNPNPQNGYGNFTFQWSTGEVTPTITVSPGQDFTYTCTVGDACNFPNETATFVLDIPDYPPLTADAGPADTVNSCFESIFLSGTVSGGDSNYVFQWYTAENIIGYQQTMVGTITETQPIYFRVMDGCGTEAIDEKMVYIPIDPLVVTMSPDTVVCLGDVVTISGEASGGEAPYTYNWSLTAVNQPSWTFQPIQSGNYTLNVRDTCGAIRSNSVFVGIENVEAIATMNYNENTMFTVDVQNFSTEGADSYLWDFGDGFMTDEFELSHTYTDTENHTITLRVTSENGCESVTQLYYIAPSLVYVPTAFTPNADGLNDYLTIEGNSVQSIKMQIFDRWGKQVYELNALNQTWGGNMQGGDYYLPIGVYNYTINGIDNYGREFTQRGSINLIR
jgi:gliding motility-associated-like protein